MAKKFNILLLFFCAIACTLAVENRTTTSTTTPSTTTSSSSTSSSTEASTTTTTTTTEKPTTTTEKPTTTTEAPTTTTNSPGPITTTAAPPLPPAEVGEWNSTCIKLRLAAQLSFSYHTLDNRTKQTKYNLPASKIVKYDDDCKVFNETTESIDLHWVDEKTKEQNSVKFAFYKNGDTYSLGIIQINLVPRTLFPDANNDSIQLIYIKNSTFVTPLHMSYHCTRQQTFDLTETITSSNVTGTITLSNVQLEAFHKKDDKTPAEWGFSSAKDCDANNTPDIVPIAVGIALSALILIVFISYLVARRRSTNRGYMSF